ncbi:MAG: hypothetical protein ACREL7_19375 [Longimicrobiales bacterium]
MSVKRGGHRAVPTASGAAGRESAGGGRQDLARFVLLGGVLLIGAGMVLVIAGILVPPLFRPGTFAIGFGLLGCGAGGALNVLSGRRAEPT